MHNHSQTEELTVSLLVEIPESLHEQLRKFLEAVPSSDLDNLATNAISHFLLTHWDQYQRQQSSKSKQHLIDRSQIVRHYLDTSGPAFQTRN